MKENESAPDFNDDILVKSLYSIVMNKPIFRENFM